MAIGRSIKDNPGTWVALGVAALLTLPPVRKALRAATITAAVGVLKLGSGVRQVGAKVVEESQTILTDATELAQEWQTPDLPKTENGSWLRKGIVSGLATTLGAAEKLTQTARQTLYQTRAATQMETGLMDHSMRDGGAGQPPQGEIPSPPAQAEGKSSPTPVDSSGAKGIEHGMLGTWLRQEVASARSMQKEDSPLLPSSLLPQTQHSAGSQHKGRHMPQGFAMQTPEAVAALVNSAHEAGAGIKPEFEEMAQAILAQDPSSSS